MLLSQLSVICVWARRAACVSGPCDAGKGPDAGCFHAYTATHDADVVSGAVTQRADEVVAVGIELLGPRVQREGVASVTEELQPGSTRGSACCTAGSTLLSAPCRTESQASLWATSMLPRPQGALTAQHCPMLQHRGGAGAPCRGLQWSAILLLTWIS